MNRIHRYIITGAPGTGKSSLLNELKNNDFSCFDEVSRTIIKEQQQINGTLFPWENLKGFAEECFIRMQRQVTKAQCGINFYDRGIPDIIAYLTHSNVEIPTYFYNSLEYYNNNVFYLPIWEEIYTNDSQRPESLAKAKKLDSFLQSTYTTLGFKLIIVNKLPTIERANLINNFIQTIKTY